MNRKYFLKILKRYNEGTATREEREFIISYYGLFEGSLPEEFRLTDEERIKLKEEIKRRIEERKEELERKPPLRIVKISRKVAAAVAVLLISGAAYFFLLKDSESMETKQEMAQSQKEEIKPGSNKAILTLANGQQIVLDEAEQGVLAQQGNSDVVKEDSSLLSYKSGTKAGSEREVTYNTIATPAGGTFKVILPDGSKVWLNAASSLRFPTAFTGKERAVEMTGEAYFEVAKNANKPFRVLAKEAEVKVLGTHFNVSAYEDDTEIKTTLEEGSVEVKYADILRKIVPGQQASFNKTDKKVTVGEVNVDQFLAWKNDLFYFDNTNIREIMKQVARWYDVEVEYEITDFSDKNYSGIVSRYSDVKELLKRMEMTETIGFDIHQHSIVVLN